MFRSCPWPLPRPLPGNSLILTTDSTPAASPDLLPLCSLASHVANYPTKQQQKRPRTDIRRYIRNRVTSDATMKNVTFKFKLATRNRSHGSSSLVSFLFGFSCPQLSRFRCGLFKLRSAAQRHADSLSTALRRKTDVTDFLNIEKKKKPWACVALLEADTN